jgi:hypothetical protein
MPIIHMGIEMSTHNNSAVFQGDYVYPREINWVRIIEDIKKESGTYSIVCKALGTPWSTLQGWRQGAEPGFTAGTGILLVHSHVCGKEKTQRRIMDAA